MVVFKVNEFIEKLKWLVNDVPNYYHSENGTWCNYNKTNGKFMMDCVVSIKGLLWGFKADKNKPHGGAIYLSNGVADFTANGGIDYCTETSQDFSNLTAGEYLCMKGTDYSHAGIYIGNGKVFECTAGWGANKCIISDITSNGDRIYNGVKGVKWTWHGKLKYIDYNEAPKQEAKYLNLKPSVSSWTVYKTNNYYIPTKTSDVAGKLNPKKFGGLSYKILQDMGNYHFKIKTVNFGTVYIAGNPNKYDCSITTTPVYKNGNY